MHTELMAEDDDTVDRIIDDVLAGHTERYERIVLLYQHAMFRYCYHMLGQVQEAEDAGQDVFVKAFERLLAYRRRDSFSGWLYTIAYRHCVNLIRRRQMRDRLYRLLQRPGQEEQTEPGYGGVELNLSLQRAMETLSAKERNVVILRLLEERSYDYVAAVMNVSAAGARKLCERAKRKLKEQLSAEGADAHEPWPYAR